ncbi:MAG: hypothetical protein IAF38_23070 [Bacteroidia bacterium]|nr:hypothetical protein [Bacteroidia bacterium]
MRIFLIIFFSFFCGSFFSQTFEMGSGLFFFKAEGALLQKNNSGTYQKLNTDGKNYFSLGATFNFYIPLYIKSTDLSVGVFSGASGFYNITENQRYKDPNLYQYDQLKNDVTKAAGVYLPLMFNLRAGRNATSNSISKVGIGFGAGLTLSGMNFDKYYYDRFFYASPSVNAELSLGKVKFRALLLLLPYKTYYIYDTGKKEKKYDISQFSVTMSITFGDD